MTRSSLLLLDRLSCRGVSGTCVLGLSIPSPPTLVGYTLLLGMQAASARTPVPFPSQCQLYSMWCWAVRVWKDPLPFAAQAEGFPGKVSL